MRDVDPARVRQGNGRSSRLHRSHHRHPDSGADEGTGGVGPAGTVLCLKDEILDEHGYKHIFNQQLLKMIEKRMAKLKSGELSPADFQIKNAMALLRELHRRGIKLYLASGTDQADVVAEAQAMGYADLFEGRIFGAVGDITVEAKKLVVDQIIRENELSGRQFATFGDGPVEMRETRKGGGLSIGVASDEVRRFWMEHRRNARG